MFEFLKLGLVDHPSNIAGVVDVKTLRYTDFRQKAVHRFLSGHIHRLHKVRNKIGLKDHHARQQDFFGNAIGLDDGVQRLLIVLDINLHPAGVSLRQGVGLVAPEGPGQGQGAVDAGHHDGGAGAGGKMKHFVHQGQPLGGGRRKGPHTGQRCRNTGGHG